MAGSAWQLDAEAEGGDKGLVVASSRSAGCGYNRAMSEVEGAVAGMDPGAVVGAKYTRNNPYLSTVTQNYLLTSSGSDKETRHLAFALDEGMTYAPGDAIGVLPENRAEDVAEVLEALGFSGEERVLDHYKVEISFEEALRTRLSIGKLTRGSIGLYAKLAGAAAVGGKGHEALKALCGPENKAHAEEYCWGREFIDLVTDFPGAVAGAAGAVPCAAASGAAAVFDCVEPAGASGRGGDYGAGGAV